MFKNVHRWLTNMSAVACGSLSQRDQWLSPVRKTKLSQVHFKTLKLVLAFAVVCLKTPALPQTS